MAEIVETYAYPYAPIILSSIWKKATRELALIRPGVGRSHGINIRVSRTQDIRGDLRIGSGRNRMNTTLTAIASL
jgi:hypothetical protein